MSDPAPTGEMRTVECPLCFTTMEPFGGEPDLACPRCGFGGSDHDERAAAVLGALGLEQVTSAMFARHRCPLGVWQEANGRVYMGDPNDGGVAIYAMTASGRPQGSTDG